MSIKYLDFDLLIERSAGGYRARVLESPAGEASAEFAPPFSDTDVDAFFVQIGQTRSFETGQTRKIHEFGQDLFEAVFSGPVRDRLRLSLGEANVQGAGLRIRLRLADTPELGSLPWEFIYDPGQSRFLALSVETPVVRYLETPQLAQPFAVQPPLRILAMICGPKDFPRLDVEREWENLQASLKDLQDRGVVDLHRLSPPTLSALQQQLRRQEYHIFHFVGHGVFSKVDQDGFLLLENELGEGRRLSGRDLGTLLHDERSLRLAVLNACEGARTALNDQFAGTAQSLIQQGIPAVIAMQFRITDRASITLAHEFYGALADGYPVDAALTEARKAIKTEGNDLEWGTPVLYMRSPDGQIFDVAPLPGGAKPIPPAGQPEPADADRVRTGVARVSLSVEDTRFSVEPGRSIAVPVTLHNQGSAADQFELALSGIPANWVTLPPAVQLMPGQRKEVDVSIQPPRTPESRAGSYPVTLNVASQAAKVEIDLTVRPFTGFSSRLLPEKIKAGSIARINIENQGNVQQAFTVDLQARESDLVFQPAQLRIQVKEGETAGADFQALPRKRSLVGGRKAYPISVRVSPEKGEPQALAGEVTSQPILPAWILAVAGMFAIILAAVICVAIVLPLLTPTPVIETWEISASRITAGEQVKIVWQVSKAQSVEIQPFGPQASSGVLVDTPQADKTYTLIARNKNKVVTRLLTVAVSGSIPPAACIPSLIIPDQGVVLDNGRTDKTDDIEWDFAWTECPGASAYQLYVISSTAAIPVIDDSTIPVTGYHHLSKGSYIADANRFNWTWKVRARVDGQWGDWSETRSFDVEPVNSDPEIASPPSGGCIPTLLSPAPGAVMDNGRTDNLDKEIWDFDWTDCPGATAYQLYVIGPAATIPIIDEDAISASSYTYSGNGYIVDANRFNWAWKVRALVDGQWGDWSETGTFDVEPVNSDIAATAVPLKPEVVLTGTDTRQAEGKTWVRYFLAVTNWQVFPADLFAPSPDLPPCGSNKNASRTWVEIHNGRDDSYIYGFCSLTDPRELESLWFDVERRLGLPNTVYVVLNDRRERESYISDLVRLQ